MRRPTRRFAVPFALQFLLACSGCDGGTTVHPDVPPDARDGDAFDDTASDDADEATPDSSDEATTDVPDDEASDVPTDGGVHECEGVGAVCVDHVTRSFCDDSSGVPLWLDEVCPAGSGCVRGECVVGECSDACNLGDTDGTRTCEPYDLATGAWVGSDPAAGLHDRSRAYQLWLRRDGMAHGGVGGNAIYSDPPTYEHVTGLGHIRDSAIWTGTYLAAEAFRLAATGSADARRNVERLVETLHLWFNVSGHPALLARFVAPAGDHPRVTMDCAELGVQCDVEFEGARYDYWGHVSRDQYQGVLLGYAAAYEALGVAGEAHRELIREDVVELVDELMLERDVPVRFVVDGITLPASRIHLRYVILDPRQMVGGAITFIIDTSDLENAAMIGFQEFTPNLAHVLRRIPLLGGTPDIPRSSSAIMLASFFRVGMLVTDGVPGLEERHDAYVDYYYHHPDEGGNVEEWLEIARTWSYDSHCGEAYYGNNISMQPMYNWARLEDDPVVGPGVRRDVLEARMWSSFVHTKNCFFSYIYAGTVPGHDPAVLDAAAVQLAQFPSPPRVDWSVDLRTDPRYLPHEDGCDDQVHHGDAVDVGERCAADFIWQSKPWELYCEGNPQVTYPGVDFLVAYWMGRHHGFLADDSPGRCLAWH